jgi:hypothetical protein
MKVDYSQAKIYKITNDVNNDIWIGSTCDTLVKKFSVHKADAIRNLRKDCIIHNLIREHGFDRFRIQLIEDFPCEDLYQLRQRQGHYIRELSAINKYADDKDYYEKNKEHISKRYKEYSQKPEVKERIKERNSETIVCECGCSLRRDSLLRHQKTKVHLNFITQKQV